MDFLVIFELSEIGERFPEILGNNTFLFLNTSIPMALDVNTLLYFFNIFFEYVRDYFCRSHCSMAPASVQLVDKK